MKHAVSLYQRFWEETVGRNEKGISHLLSIPMYRSDPEISERWATEYIYAAIYQFLLKLPMIPVGDERKALYDPELHLVGGRRCP